VKRLCYYKIIYKGGVMKKLIQTLFFLLLVSQICFAQWVQANGPYVGNINCLAASGAIIFAGTDGGVFRSTDDGTSWTAVNEGLMDTSVYALAAFGTNLFALTDSSIFLSTDNGTNWTTANIPFRYFFQTVQMGTNIYALADTILHRSPFFYGQLYHSTDNGINWTLVDGGLSNRHLSALAISGTTLLAANSVSWDSCYIFASTDSGVSWTKVSSCIPSAVVSLVATNAGTLLAETYLFGPFHPSRLLLSTNSGVEWTQVKDLDTTSAWSLAISDSTLFAWTSDSVLLSTDSGTSWTRNSGPSNLKCVVVSGTKLLAGTYGGGVFRSTNSGTTWRRVGIGLKSQDIWRLAECLNEAGGTSLYVGTPPLGGTTITYGIYLSTNNGTDWTAANTPFENFTRIVQTGTNLFAGTYGGGGVYLSTNNGASWAPVNKGLPLAIPNDSSYGYAWITDLAISGTNIFAGTEGGHGVYLSTNMGTTWESISSPGANAFAVIGSNIFASNWNGVFLSTDNGTSWAPVNQGLPKVQGDTTATVPIECLAVSGANLFAACKYSWGSGFQSGIYLSTNNGTSWTKVDSGLPPDVIDVNPQSLAASGSNIFAVVGVNIYLSTNNGTSWTSVYSADLPDTYAHSLTIGATHLFAARTGSGVWRRPLSEMITAVETNKDDLPTAFALEQNYPNPFNPSTKISWQLTVGSQATLKVYDILGKEVASLVNEYRQAGKYETEFNAEVLSSGVYFYQLKAGDFLQTKKMILLK
jgi:hypothetical protein